MDKLRLASPNLDAGQIIKEHNDQCSSRGALTGGKRVAVLNLMQKAPSAALAVLVRDLSEHGASKTAFTDDCWANKKLFPGFCFPAPAGAWKSRRLVSDESFMLFIRHVIQQQSERIANAKRKWEKPSLEDACQMAAAVFAFANEAKMGSPMTAHAVIDLVLVEGFVKNDSNIVLEMQAHVHELQPSLTWRDLNCLKVAINTEVVKADVIVTGVEKTTQIAQKLEEDEFTLDMDKIRYDLAMVADYRTKIKSRESRTYFRKLEKVQQKCNKVANVVKNLVDPANGNHRFSFSKEKDQQRIWLELQKFMETIQRREALPNLEAISVLAITNWTAPSLIPAEHIKLQAAMMGAVAGMGKHCAGLLLQPVFAYKQGQVMAANASLMKLIENNNGILDSNFSVVFERKSTEREDRPMNYPGRMCVMMSEKNQDKADVEGNHWCKTQLFGKGLVIIPEMQKSRDMIRMEDFAEDALPSDTSPVTHVNQPEKHSQLGPETWKRVLEASVGTLPPRKDIGRGAVLVVDTHVRTGEVARGFAQLLGSFQIPHYFFGLTAENKAVDELDFIKDDTSHHVTSHCITSRHFTSLRFTSLHFTSHMLRPFDGSVWYVFAVQQERIDVVSLVKSGD